MQLFTEHGTQRSRVGHAVLYKPKTPHFTPAHLVRHHYCLALGYHPFMPLDVTCVRAGQALAKNGYSSPILSHLRLASIIRRNALDRVTCVGFASHAGRQVGQVPHSLRQCDVEQGTALQDLR